MFSDLASSYWPIPLTEPEIFLCYFFIFFLRDQNEAGVSPCPYADEFGCVENVGEHQLCILTDPLTCNLLPNCAQNVSGQRHS